MDSLTQAVLGVAISQATLGKKIKKSHIVLYGALIGTIPDLDVLVGKWFYDPITAVEIHRGLSHSVIFYLILSFVLARWISWRERINQVAYWQAYRAVFFILLTHSLLDIFTTWGTQLFWPFEWRLAIKSIFVIDPLYTIPLLIGVIFSCFSKKENKRLIYNKIGLIISTLYLFVTVGLQQTARQKVLHDGRFNNVEIQNVTVKPTAFNTILWQIIAEGENDFYMTDYSFFDSGFAPVEVYPKNHQLLQNIKNEEVIRQLIKISENQYTVTEENGKLFFNDLRFGFLNKNPDSLQFAFSYEIIQNPNSVIAREVEKDRKDGKKLLQQLAKRIQGN